MRVAALLAVSGLASLGAFTVADAQETEARDPRGPKQARAVRIGTPPGVSASRSSPSFERSSSTRTVWTSPPTVPPGDKLG